MKKWVIFLAVASSGPMARAEPEPGKEIAVGQMYRETRAVLRRNDFPTIEYPFTIMNFGPSEIQAIKLDDQAILTLKIDPLHETLAGMTVHFLPRRGDLHPPRFENEVSKVGFNSKETYSIELKRDLRTEGEREKEIQVHREELKRKLRERDEAADARAAPGTKAPKLEWLETNAESLGQWKERAAKIVFGSNQTVAFDPRKEATATTSDKAIISEVISSAVGKKPAQIEPGLRKPFLPLVVLDEAGAVLGAFMLDRTPEAGDHGTRAILREAWIEWEGDKLLVGRVSLSEGYPCKALEPFCMDDLDVPPLRAVEGDKDLPVPANPKNPPK